MNTATGRANGRVLADLMLGGQVLRHGTMRVDAETGLLNVFNTNYLVNFLSIFNGTHYGAPRTWMARLKVAF